MQFSSLCISMFEVPIWCLYLGNRVLYGVLPETTFLTKTAEHDLSLTSITFDLGWPRVKYFQRMRRIDGRRGTENFKAFSQPNLSYWRKTTRAFGPPSGRRLTLARSGGVDAPPPPWVFLSWTSHRLEDRAEIFHNLWGILCATFGEKNLVGSGQVTKLWRHKRNNLRKISAKSWVNATWRGAIDLNGDSWWDWCQYMTGCDPWHCARWVPRSTKVTWGHWPRLNSQWQITNRHMFSGVSWGAESESVVHCP